MSDMQFRAVRNRSNKSESEKRLIQNQWFDLEKRREPNHYAEQLKYNRDTRSASRLLRSLSVDGSCYVRVALWRTGRGSSARCMYRASFRRARAS
jgi:hypothetical protein